MGDVMSRIKDTLIDFESSMDLISEYRNKREYKIAIQECLKQVESSIFKDFKFYYYKELGELYSLVNNYGESIVAYINAFENITDNSRIFNIFARSVDRFLKGIQNEYYILFREAIIKKLRNQNINLAYQISNLIEYPFPLEDFLSPLGNDLANVISNDANFQYMVKKLQKLESQARDELRIILDLKVLNRSRTRETLRIDKYCITVYERFEEYHKAQKIAFELTKIDQDPVTIRSLFRLCRKGENYDLVNQLLIEQPNIEKRDDFNILYELVYYYDKINNTPAKKNILSKIENYSSSLPILKTLKNLYLRFGTLDDVLRVENMITKLFKNSSKKRSDAVKDSEASVWSALENSKRLEALANLTQGISHELGQPITNIRFMIQYYLGNNNLSNIGTSTIAELFHTILIETERMGDLINRLSPMTTTKNTNIKYNIVERIRQRVKVESTKLKAERIHVTVKPMSDVLVYGDPSMFDQIISNLLINSVHSLQSVTNKKKSISILITEQRSKIRISFQDNGTGISQDIRRKIFEPFFTTKPTGQGQGLGLFIIWNLLKYQGGTIFLDYQYTNGARFFIELPKEAIRYE